MSYTVARKLWDIVYFFRIFCQFITFITPCSVYGSSSHSRCVLHTHLLSVCPKHIWTFHLHFNVVYVYSLFMRELSSHLQVSFKLCWNVLLCNISFSGLVRCEKLTVARLLRNSPIFNERESSLWFSEIATLNPDLRQLNPVQTLSSYFFMIHFNNIPPSTRSDFSLWVSEISQMRLAVSASHRFLLAAAAGCLSNRNTALSPASISLCGTLSFFHIVCSALFSEVFR
jgi:hypothetical protein